MANRDPGDDKDRNRRRNWDYSSHPLKAGGMTIVAVVLGFGGVLLLGALAALWLSLSQ